MEKISRKTSNPILDQVSLMKQFIGNWTCQYGKGTILVIENIPFGAGMVSNCQIIQESTVLDSIRQLYGYDKKTDKFIMAELIESSAGIEICTIWFTSRNSGEMVVTNTENAKYKWSFKFKTPDLIHQIAKLDGKLVKEVMLTRTKSK
jgi:hypothetical protein